jgi:hypothetical protein
MPSLSTEHGGASLCGWLLTKQLTCEAVDLVSR